MKKLLFIILILALAACRPSREFNQVADFSNMIESVHRQNETLLEQIRQSENRQLTSLENLQRQHAESEHRRENENVIIREFDTQQPDNPIIRETIIERITESETQVTSAEMRDIFTELFESILMEKEADFERNTLNIVAENTQLRQEIREKETRARTNFLTGFGVGGFVVLAVVLIFLVVLRKLV
jgi:Tfp pilus assembly protein PilP